MTVTKLLKKSNILMFSILLFCFMLFSFNVNAQNPFKYERPFTVYNTGSAQTNFQVPIKVNTQQPISMGHMATDGKDIRFVTTCGGTTYLGYYIGGYLNTDSTQIWVKMNLPSNDSVLVYMYYGNPGATAMSSLSIFDGPHSSTDSVMMTSTNTVSNCQRGFRFTPNQNIIVTHFGKRTPNATQRYVTLFDFNTQAIIMQGQVPAGTATQYNYNLLPSPVMLQQGRTCILALFNGAGDMYYYGNSSQIGQHLTYHDMKYANSCTQNTFPTSTLSNYHYGQPDFLYYVGKSATPAPTFAFAPYWADTTAPSAPQNLVATGSNGVAYLIWSQNPEMDIQRYDIYRNEAVNPGSATLIGNNPYPDTTYTDNTVVVGHSYYYWLKAVDRYCIPRVSPYSAPDSTGIITGIAGNEPLPDKYELYQNYPNPFNPTTTIKFDIPKATHVKLYVYDILGRVIAKLVDEKMDAGRHEAVWYAHDFTSGFYVYRIEAGNYEKKMKMMLIK